MSKKRTDSSWDSDEELLGDAPGGNAYPKSAELDVLTNEGEIEDEDALLSLEQDVPHIAEHDATYDTSEHVQDEQAFVFEEVDTGDLEEELNVVGEEESGYQDQIYEGDGDYDETYQAENVEDSSGLLAESDEYLAPDGVSEEVGYGETESVAVSYENTGDDGAVELQYGQDTEREVVLAYGDGGDTATDGHGESEQPSGERLESESESDDEDSRRNRGRFKTERTGVISLATSKERSTIPDTLEIDDEQAAQINKFMTDKPPSQRGGKKPSGGRGRQSVHSRLGPRQALAPREAQGPGLLQGARPPFPLGLQPQINPRMLMGIIRGGGMQALRGLLPTDLIGPRGPMGLRPLGGPRGPLPEGPLGQRVPFPLRLGAPGGIDMRGRMPGPRGPGERGPFPPGLQPRGPFAGPNRGPPPPLSLNAGPRGPNGPLQRGPLGGPPQRGLLGGPPQRGPSPLGPRGPMSGPPPRAPPGGPINMSERMRGPGPNILNNLNQVRGPSRGPPSQPLIRPLMTTEPLVRGMLRNPSPLRSPGPGNLNIRGPSIHDRLGPRVPLKLNPPQTTQSNAVSQSSEEAISSEGQPIPSLVKPAPAAQQSFGGNQGNRQMKPPLNARLGNAPGLRQPNAKGPRALLSQNATRPGSGPNKIFINPRFSHQQDESNNQGVTRTVKIGQPLQRRPKVLLNKAMHDESVEANKVPVVAMKRRSSGADDVPNKIIRIGDNQPSRQGNQNYRNVNDDQNKRNVVVQRRDMPRDRLVASRNRDFGKRTGPPAQSLLSSSTGGRDSGSSVQSRLGPPVSRPATSRSGVPPNNQGISFDPTKAPPNFPPRGPPQVSRPPRPLNPPGGNLFSQPPPSIRPPQRPQAPTSTGNRFTSPPPGSAPLPTRFSGPPPASSTASRFTTPPPAINMTQPPPNFTAPPPRFQATVTQAPPTFQAAPPTTVPSYPPPISQVAPHYPPPAVPATVATYTQPPPAYPAQSYAPIQAVPVVAPAAQPPNPAYQAIPTYPAPPSVAQPYQHPLTQPAVITYASAPAYKPTVAPSYPPTQQQTATAAAAAAAAAQYPYYDYSATSAHYQTPSQPAASQAYQAPQHSYPQSSYYDYNASQQATSSLSTQSSQSSLYDNQPVQQITTIGRRAQPATDSQVRSIIHNVAPSRSSSSQSSSSGRVVVDTSVPVLRGPQKVAIYNLAQMATKETLIKVCRHFGKVMNVQLMRDENKAIVQFETGDQAAKCVSKCDQKCLHKSRLTVKLLPN